MGLFPPAPFRRMSTVPNFSRMVSRAASRLALSRTFAPTAMAVPPSLVISSTTFCAASTLRSQTATFAPLAARAFANSEQRTPPPPVTRATFPDRSILNGNFMMDISFLCSAGGFPAIIIF